MLHRLSCYIYDPVSRRMKKENSPWNPSKESIEAICSRYYNDLKVTFETAKFKNPYDYEDSIPTVIDSAEYSIDEDIYSPHYGEPLVSKPNAIVDTHKEVNIDDFDKLLDGFSL